MIREAFTGRGAPGTDTAPARRIDTRVLFGDREAVVTIVHDGQEYRLRITKANKLILTK